MSSQAGRYTSPLRYPGGKGKVANFVKMLMLENGLVGRDYVEPYAGGGSVALSLLYDGFADTVHINDLNAGVHAFWSAVLSETAEFCDRVRSAEVSVEEWHRQREVLRSNDPDPIDLGFATFFLNRTNRSGIIGGGVIGGLNQDGPWKIDARFNKDGLVERIEKVGRYRTRIHLTNEDAANYLARWGSAAEERAFLYLDPPYFTKGEGLYDNFYEPSDHASVALAVSRLAHPWIVSYDAHPEIIGLYSDQRHIRYGLSYSAATRVKGSEVMFFSDDLDHPDLEPSQVRTRDVLAAQRASAGLHR